MYSQRLKMRSSEILADENRNILSGKGEIEKNFHGG